MLNSIITIKAKIAIIAAIAILFVGISTGYVLRESSNKECIKLPSIRNSVSDFKAIPINNGRRF